MTAAQVAGMVLAIVAAVALVQAAVWIPIRRKLARMPEILRAELAASGEHVLRGPEAVVYRGASAAGYSRLKGNGVIALTDRRLLIRTAIGKGAAVPLAAMAGVRGDKWFLSSYVGGRTHVIVRLRDGGEVGFFAADPDGWQETLRDIIQRGPR